MERIRTEIPLPPFALTFDLELVARRDRRIEAQMRQGQVARLLVEGDPYHLHIPVEGGTRRAAARLQTCRPEGDALRLTFVLAEAT